MKIKIKKKVQLPNGVVKAVAIKDIKNKFVKYYQIRLLSLDGRKTKKILGFFIQNNIIFFNYQVFIEIFVNSNIKFEEDNIVDNFLLLLLLTYKLFLSCNRFYFSKETFKKVFKHTFKVALKYVEKRLFNIETMNWGIILKKRIKMIQKLYQGDNERGIVF